MGRFLLGVIFTLVVAPFALLGWFRIGNVPVAVGDQPFPYERVIVSIPLDARIDREMVKTPPIPVNEANLAAGARIYSEECAVCHGLHGKRSAFGEHMYPNAPPLWEEHHQDNVTIVGVCDDPSAETYWKVANGIRLTGMPAYKRVLTDTEIWQVSLLLANADKPLPSAAVGILRGETHAAAANPAANTGTK